MAAIRALAPNGLTVASTFSGAGGSSLGYRLAGYRVAWASEFVDAARDTYAANASPETILDGRDIRLIQPAEILAAIGIGRGDLDLLDGSPPCSSFSTVGSMEAGWGKVKAYSDRAQRTDDLFFEFARILDGLQPRVFIAENVSGLVKGTAKGYFLAILAALKDCGYRIEAKLLDAQWLGVPQARQRIIFQGVRNDLNRLPAWPRPLAWRYSVRDALPIGFGAAVEPETDISRYAIGREWDKLRPGEATFYGANLTRPALNRPCPTLTFGAGALSAAGVLHPLEKRRFSIAELRRICAFPDDFVLTGTYSQQWERLGRAVPPVMMAAIAAAVRDGPLAGPAGPRRYPVPARSARNA